MHDRDEVGGLLRHGHIASGLLATGSEHGDTGGGLQSLLISVGNCKIGVKIGDVRIQNIHPGHKLLSNHTGNTNHGKVAVVQLPAW